MKKIVILSIIAFVIFAGCTGKTDTNVKTEDGKETVSGGSGVGTDWCKAGTAWSGSASQPQSGDSSYQYMIKGITSYKGKSLCEAEAKITGASGGNIYYTYYFSEDGKYGAMIMKDQNGKVLSENEFNNP